MISIKKYLQADREAQQMLDQMCRLLLAAMEDCGGEDVSAESSALRESTRKVTEALDRGATPPEILELAGRAARALPQFHRQVLAEEKQQVDELRAKLKILMAAMTAISSSSHQTIRRLRDIREQVVSVIDIKQLRSLRVKVGDCLDDILAQAERQRAETDLAAEQLNRSSIPLTPAAGSTEEGRAPDPATGLPDRGSAEEAIAEACQDEAPAFVVLMVLNRGPALASSFGQHVANVILRRFSTFVREQLPPADQVFRWSGPAVVALVRRGSLDKVRAEIDTLMGRKLEHSVNTVQRTVLLSISARWSVLPLVASPRLLFHKMDSFADLD